MDVFEAIYSTRAMRRLKPDPVPDDLIWKVLDAAIRAPSGGNRQPWNFIVIKDEDTKKQIAGRHLDACTLGLGTTLTTLHRAHEDKVKALLGIPEGTETMCLIPLGWPKGKFGPAARMPVDVV